MKGSVTTIRIDLPPNDPRYKGAFAYFFISVENGQRWHPWWNTLFGFLLELERQPVGLSGDGVEMEVALMTGKTRQDFLKLLQAAPQSEVERHQTLRSALRRLPLHELDVPVRYFGPDPESRGSE